MGSDRMVVMLADNVVEYTIRPAVERFEKQAAGARILLSRVGDAAHLKHLGVPELDASGRVLRIIEKPEDPPARSA